MITGLQIKKLNQNYFLFIAQLVLPEFSGFVDSWFAQQVGAGCLVVGRGSTLLGRALFPLLQHAHVLVWQLVTSKGMTLILLCLQAYRIPVSSDSIINIQEAKGKTCSNSVFPI